MQLSVDPKMLNDIVNANSRLETSNKNEDDTNTAVFENQLAEIDRQIRKLLDLYQFAAMPMSEISERIRKLQAEKDSIEININDVRKVENQKRFSRKEVEEMLPGLPDVLLSDNIAKKRAVVHMLIKQIVIYPEQGEFEIIWNF